MSTNYNDLIHEFKQYKKRENLKLKSIEEYCKSIIKFQDWYCEEKQVAHIKIRGWKNISTRDCQEYAHFLRKNESLSIATTKKYLAGLKEFFIFLIKEYKLDESPCYRIKIAKDVEKKEEKYITLEEAQLIFDNADTTRDKLLIGLQRFNGLRGNEAISIETKNIDLENGKFKVLRKNGKWQTMSIRSEIIELIKEVNSNCRQYLFQSKTGKPLTTKTARNIFNGINDKLGLDKEYSAHKLRHVCAVDLYYNKGKLLHEVSNALGHSSLKTTEIYMKGSSKILGRDVFSGL